MDDSFPSLSVVTASRDRVASWWPVPRLWFMVGWGGLGTASRRLQPFSRQGPAAAHGQGSWMGCRECLHGRLWWELELDRGLRPQEGSSRQLHLNRVVVADCQGLEEGERWGGVTQGFGEPLAVLVGSAEWL